MFEVGKNTHFFLIIMVVVTTRIARQRPDSGRLCPTSLLHVFVWA